jgi:hypothetical protein
VPKRSKHPLLTHRAPFIRESGLVSMERSLTEYEINHSAYRSVIICNCKQGHHSECRICDMITLNEIRYNPAISTFFVSSWHRFEKSSYV